MSKTTVKFRPFPVWNSDGELKWLEEMASRGYRLVKSRNPVYFFERAEPESVSYCHGFGRIKSKDKDDYFQLYADAGWQHISSWFGWHYFKSSVATATDMDRATVTRDNAKCLKFVALIYLVMLVLYSLWFASLWIRGVDYDSVVLLEQGVIGIGGWAFGYWIMSYSRRRQLAKLGKINTQ